MMKFTLCLLGCSLVVQCTQAANPCLNKPCLNGGTCRTYSWLKRAYRCYCPDEYYGDNCEHASPCLTGNPCQSGGTCEPVSSGKGYNCICPKEYLGNNCEIGNPCINGGRCFNGGTCVASKYSPVGFWCRCPKGIGGNRCQKVSRCGLNPCQNGGTCRDAWSRDELYICKCPDSYAGYNCQNKDPCIGENPCKNGGTCASFKTYVYNNFEYDCTCTNMYYGTRCQYPTKCHTTKCENGGTCESYDDEYAFCRCPAGYRGDTCQHRTCPVKTDIGDLVFTGEMLNFRDCTIARKADLKKLGDIYKEHYGKILDSGSCDCRPDDVIQHLFSDSLAENKGIAEWHCFYSIDMHVELKDCSAEAQKCADLIYRVTLKPGSTLHCDAADKLKLLTCLERFSKGDLNLTNCDMLAVVMKLSKNLRETLPLHCTECDPWSLYKNCSNRLKENHKEFMCQAIKSVELTKCVVDMIQKDRNCNTQAKHIIAAHRYKMIIWRKKYGRACGELRRFKRIWSQYWGCRSPLDNNNRAISEEPDGSGLIHHV